MPIFPPRVEPIKKKEQLLKREIELQHAIKNNFTNENLVKAAEKYRSSQLSFLKAKIHEIEEKQFLDKQCNIEKKKIEADILMWINRSTEEIIQKIQVTN